MERTTDPATVIIGRTSNTVTYANDDHWVIRGVCSGCGTCDGDYPHSGPPEDRLDIPVRPEGPPTWPGCTLRGEYL